MRKARIRTEKRRRRKKERRRRRKRRRRKKRRQRRRRRRRRTRRGGGKEEEDDENNCRQIVKILSVSLNFSLLLVGFYITSYTLQVSISFLPWSWPPLAHGKLRYRRNL